MAMKYSGAKGGEAPWIFENFSFAPINFKIFY